MALRQIVPTVIKADVEGRSVTFPRGFKAGALRAGLKSKRKDVALIVSEKRASAAGMFTTNVVQAPSVPFSKGIVQKGFAQAIFCNAGNANACNGPQGEKDNAQCVALAASGLGLSPESVLVASTGVIGKPMPMHLIAAASNSFEDCLGKGEEADDSVAGAILTTDTFAKQIAVELHSQCWDGSIRIGGVAKGSGMIAPNMATTLAFITTDAEIEPALLQESLKRAIDGSFNRITVDGDTSTNDMVLALANGASGVKVDSRWALAEFQSALEDVCLRLAKMVAADGEGATKLVGVTVKGAASETDAAKIARTIAESPLVKTALFGCDPNWGRIMAAAGRAGVPFDPYRAEAWIGEFQVFAQGTGCPFDRGAVNRYLGQREVQITVDLGSGEVKATFWTCDYSYDYIKINAEYHT